jgi:TetR/AcrR family transcriptional regulator, transcriptional repressor for nem operon
VTKTDTREILIEQGLKALLDNGYDGTGIGPILKSAGVPKGSFYHFFESKEAFASAVLETYAERYRNARNDILSDRSRPPIDRLRRYFDYLERLFDEDGVHGCLFGRLSQSAAPRSDNFRRKLNQAFAQWQEDLAHVLQEAQDRGELSPELDPDQTAAFLIDAYEGALVRAKVEEDTAPLRRFTSIMLERLLSPGR